MPFFCARLRLLTHSEHVSKWIYVRCLAETWITCEERQWHPGHHTPGHPGCHALTGSRSNDTTSRAAARPALLAPIVLALGP
jgi:hypothetical protein